MPARKPQELHSKNDRHIARKQKRGEAESAMLPERSLPTTAPARLRGHKIAEDTWRRIMREYSGIEAKIVTRLDQDLLVDYCMMMEQVSELDTMRSAAFQAWLELSAHHEELKHEGQTEQAIFLAIEVVGAFDAIIKLDARSERKRALLKQYREALYLTPRARAGVAPNKKEAAPPPDPMEQLLGTVTDFVNGDE